MGINGAAIDTNSLQSFTKIVHPVLGLYGVFALYDWLQALLAELCMRVFTVVVTWCSGRRHRCSPKQQRLKDVTTWRVSPCINLKQTKCVIKSDLQLELTSIFCRSSIPAPFHWKAKPDPIQAVQSGLVVPFNQDRHRLQYSPTEWSITSRQMSFLQLPQSMSAKIKQKVRQQQRSYRPNFGFANTPYDTDEELIKYGWEEDVWYYRWTSSSMCNLGLIRKSRVRYSLLVQAVTKQKAKTTCCNLVPRRQPLQCTHLSTTRARAVMG